MGTAGVPSRSDAAEEAARSGTGAQDETFDYAEAMDGYEWARTEEQWAGGRPEGSAAPRRGELFLRTHCVFLAEQRRKDFAAGFPLPHLEFSLYFPLLPSAFFHVQDTPRTKWLV